MTEEPSIYLARQGIETPGTFMALDQVLWPPFKPIYQLRYHIFNRKPTNNNDFQINFYAL